MKNCAIRRPTGARGKSGMKSRRYSRLAWLAFALTLSVPLAAQLAPSKSTGAIGGGYRVGRGDTLNVSVFGSQELSGKVQVGLHGHIYLPYDPEPILATGKTVAQLVPIIEQSLVAHQLELQPKVLVQIVSVKSRPIIVLGAVRQPITLQAVMPVTLRQCLTQASGLTTQAGRYILLTTPGPQGQLRTRKLLTEQVLFSSNPADNPLLSGGDEVRVTYGSQFYVSGDANAQGAFPIDFNNRMTVLRAVALMHGWKSNAKPEKTILVRSFQGKLQIIHLNLPEIVAQRQADMALRPNDVIYVPTNGLKTVSYAALTAALTILTTASATTLGVRLAK